MPAIEPASNVLVTGASGYIAAWTCQLLLERGFTVRGTVRNQTKGEYLSNLFQKFENNWSYVIIEDVEKPNGFDEAVQGMDGIAHIASPFHLNVTDPHKDLIDPAVNGTESILKSANGPNGKSIKRIVITSSFAAVNFPTEDLDYVFSEKDWNQYSAQVVQEMGNLTPPTQAYCASKLAEKAAWRFVEENKPTFDLVTILPPYVLGPILHSVQNSKSLNTSVKPFYDYLMGESDASSAIVAPSAPAVDVRDVALSHLQSLLIEKAGGNRFAITKQTYTWQDTLDIINDHGHAQHWPKSTKGTPGSGKSVKQNLYDNSKSIEYLEFEYHSFDSTILDMSSSLIELSKKW